MYAEWSTWGSFSECSVTCGIGTWIRTRTCNDTNTQDDITTCIGNFEEISECFIERCPGMNLILIKLCLKIQDIGL